MKHYAVLIAVLLVVAVACSSREMPTPTRAVVHPYEPSERGKFVEVCLNRSLELNESYEFTMTFLTTAGNSQQCSGILANGLGQPPRACHRMNVFVYCLTRHSSEAERAIVYDEMNTGMIQALTLRLWARYREDDAQTFTFRGL